MGKKAAPPKSEKDRSERWLLTYSDLITLLMVFFVVLYSMSVLDANKFNAMAQAMSVAFTGGGGGNGVLDAGRSIVPGESIYKERLELQNTQKKIRKMIAKKNLEDKISTEIGERGLVISVKDTILFLPGAVTLAPSARELITSVAAILAKMPNSIRIEGHTDDQPIHTERYFSNWELSTARATNVLQYFIQDGIKPSRLCAAGYGEFKPLVQNTSEHNRGLNRRVDIVLVSNEANKYEPGSIIKPGLDDSLDGAATKLYSDSATVAPADTGGGAVKDTGAAIDGKDADEL